MAAVALNGCAQFDSIHRRDSLPVSSDHARGQIITVDAKQRHLLVVPERGGTDRATSWRICAEAAPDVFSAYAASLALRGDKTGGEASFGGAETAASIERTQTINMLRESFYRTCERYASGAINRTQLVIQAARDQRSMVTILAIEQLTGAVRPKSTVIAGPLTSASALSGSAAADLVKDANQRLKLAEGARDKAQSALAAAQKDGGACGTTDGKDEAACAVLETALSAAKQDVATAQTAMDDAVKLAKDLIAAASASAGGGTSLQGGGVAAGDIDKSALAAVAEAVVRISVSATINEPLMFCIGMLSDPEASIVKDPAFFPPESRKRVVDGCVTMLEEQQRGDAIRTGSLFSGVVLTPVPGEQENRLARYLDPALPQAELARRMRLTQQAMQSAALSSSAGAVMALLVSGPEADRQKVVAALLTLETEAPARSALQ